MKKYVLLLGLLIQAVSVLAQETSGSRYSPFMQGLPGIWGK